MAHQVCLLGDIARIILTRGDLALDKDFIRLRSDVYGAISVRFESDDLTEMRFSFDLIIEDEDPNSLDFNLEPDFTVRAIQLGKMTRPKSLQRHFATTVDLGTLLLADEGDVAQFRRDLAREWLAQFLGANFRFKAEIRLRGNDLSAQSRALITLTDSRTGREELFFANFDESCLEDGQDYIQR